MENSTSCLPTILNRAANLQQETSAFMHFGDLINNSRLMHRKRPIAQSVDISQEMTHQLQSRLRIEETRSTKGYDESSRISPDTDPCGDTRKRRQSQHRPAFPHA